MNNVIVNETLQITYAIDANDATDDATDATDKMAEIEIRGQSKTCSCEAGRMQ